MKLKGKRKIALYLLIPLLLMTGVLLLDFFYVRAKMADSAVQNAGSSARHVLNETRRNLSVTQTAVKNFLAMYSYQEHHKDEETGEDIAYPSIDLRDNTNTTRGAVYSSLEGFVVANPQVLAAAFVFEKDNPLSVNGRGFVPLVYRDGLRHMDLLEEKDIYSSSLYKRGKSSYEPFFSSPTYVARDSVTLVTYVQPIYNRQKADELLFQMWVDINLDSLCELLDGEEPYPEARSFVLDNKMNIIANDDGEHLGERFQNVIASDPKLKGLLDEDILHYYEGDELNSAWEASWQNEDYIVNFYPVADLGISVIIMLPHDSVFESLRKVYSHMFISVLVLFVLLLAFLVISFYFYMKEEREVARTAGELAIAAEIQQGFLPCGSLQRDSLDFHASTRPAEEVGGDFYDYVEKDGKLFFCLGDVSGKSIPAAIFMSMTGSLFRTAVRLADDTAEIASIINGALVERNEEDMFCTMLIGAIDPVTGAISFCNAGHNPPLAVSPGADTHYIEVIPNRPLGLLADKPFASQQDALLPGQSLFVYSDGVTEARSTTRAFYGVQRLMETLQNAPAGADAQALVKYVADSVDAFRAGAPQSDDITMLCIRRRTTESEQ